MNKMNYKTINAIIQARMGSSRLPGKVLMEIEGIPILEHIVRRLKCVNDVNAVIIATSIKEEDDAVEVFCEKRNIPCIRGSEDNVLERFGVASKEYPSEIYIRATGDNPMIDVKLINGMLHFFVENDLSYTCYKNYPIGSGVEIFTKEALGEALEKADKAFEREHVTPYMYQRMTDGKVEYYVSKDDDSKIRMTVDTESDFQFAKEMFKRLYKDNELFGISEIKEVLEQDPSLASINSETHQKTLEE